MSIWEMEMDVALRRSVLTRHYPRGAGGKVKIERKAVLGRDLRRILVELPALRLT